MRLWGAVALVLLITPSVAAGWMAWGGSEPSTSYDHPGYVWADADVDPGAGPRAYFQAFQAVDETSLNPNLAATGSRILPPGAVHHRALLGHWRDCNRDGYVGHAESALLDYASVLLPDTGVCPPTPGGYNDGQWVSEMIGIGMVDPCEYTAVDGELPPRCDTGTVDDFHPNERVLYANGTMVWGDLGEPGARPPRECPLAPPPGTTSGTGTLLAYADCQDARQIAQLVNAVDADGSLGLRFEDEERPERSTSLLNVAFPVTPFGGPQGSGLLEAGADERAATAWDCNDRKAVDVRDDTGLLRDVTIADPSGDRLTGPQPTLPVVGVITLFEDHDEDAQTPGVIRPPLTDADGSIVWIPAPAPALGTPTASWWDALEHAADGPRGDCAEGTPGPMRRAAPGALVESGAPQVDEARKDRASFAFTFYDGHRGLNERVDFALGPNAPADAGLPLFRHGRGGDGPLWSADQPALNEPQLVTRGTLEVSGAEHFTYYAYLGPAATSIVRLPGGGATSRYGQETCGAFTSGVHEGWVCDASLWWRDALGRDVRPRYVGEHEGAIVHYAPVPGQAYHLRDVDCYDGHAAQGVFASAAVLSPSICA